MPVFTHPQSGHQVTGMRLAAGAILQEGDVYDSTTGVWEPCPIPGLTLEECPTKWIRPEAELSENAQALLAQLNLWGGDLFGCIARSGADFYVIPSPTYNWDRRIEIRRVNHPEVLQELVDYGYLTLGEYEFSRWGAKNNVFTLTQEGKIEGARLLGS